METKFKVGEKVRVKKGIKAGTKMPNGLRITNDMERRAGSIVTISGIVPSFSLSFCPIEKDDIRYEIIEDDGAWIYADNVLEKLEPMKLKDLQFGDIITLRNKTRYVYASGYMYGENDNYCLDCVRVAGDYDYNFEYLDADSKNNKYDIVKVERNGYTIFELENKVKEMTLKEICKELGYEVKVVKEK